ncbi:MAG: TorF family putative porin [Pseudomonadales bacterium]|nr:TorF family putative porin [Pseudomonadales bacterium]
MKKLIAGLLLLSAGFASAAEIAGNVALTTDYRFRGISQTDRDPAVQGGFDIAFENGLYAGTWASSIQYGGSVEMDFYGGWVKEFNDDVSLDLGYMYYYYPSDNSDPDLDLQEFYAKLGFYGATVGVIYSDDYFAKSGEFWYLFGDYSVPLGEQFSLDLHVGYNELDGDQNFVSNYFDYSIGVSTSVFGADLSLAYVDTDVSNSDCGDKLCEGSAVFTISKSL